jgi:hypothetical protein
VGGRGGVGGGGGGREAGVFDESVTVLRAGPLRSLGMGRDFCHRYRVRSGAGAPTPCSLRTADSAAEDKEAGT